MRAAKVEAAQRGEHTRPCGRPTSQVLPPNAGVARATAWSQSSADRIVRGGSGRRCSAAAPRELTSQDLLEGFATLVYAFMGMLDEPLNLVPAVIRRLRTLQLVPDEVLPTMAGALTAAALWQSPLCWRRVLGPMTLTPHGSEALAWSYAAWLLADFYASTQVPWRVNLAAPNMIHRDLAFSGPVASVAAPGARLAGLTTTIDWGDGTSSAGTLSGTEATSTTINSLYTASGSHTYAASGVYHARITVSRPGSSATARFTVVAGGASS
jgi:hypothetical protein